jgi:hypothetical protein
MSGYLYRQTANTTRERLKMATLSFEMFVAALDTCEEDIELGAAVMRAELVGHDLSRTPDWLKSSAWRAGMARVTNGTNRRHTIWGDNKQHHKAFLARSRADIEAKRAAIIETLEQIAEGKEL